MSSEVVFCPDSLSVVQSWFQGDDGAEENPVEKKQISNHHLQLYGSSKNQVSSEVIQLRQKVFGKSAAFLTKRKKQHIIENDEDTCTDDELPKHRKQQSSPADKTRTIEGKRKLNSHDEILEQLRDSERRRKAKNEKQKRRKQRKKGNMNSTNGSVKIQW